MNAGQTVRLRVMIVEDEVIIAMDLAAMMRELGHEVVKLANRVDTGAAFATSGEFDLAILDVNVRGELSFPIAAILRERGIPFIFASGYGERGLIDGFRDTPVLTKPYTAVGLAEVLTLTLPESR